MSAAPATRHAPASPHVPSDQSPMEFCMHYAMDENAQAQLETAHHLAQLLASGMDCMTRVNEEIPPAQAAAAFRVLAEHIGHVLHASPLTRQ